MKHSKRYLLAAGLASVMLAATLSYMGDEYEEERKDIRRKTIEELKENKDERNI